MLQYSSLSLLSDILTRSGSENLHCSLLRLILMRSDSEPLDFIFRSEKRMGLLMQSDFAKSAGIKSDLRIRWPNSSACGQKSDDSTHRILKQQNGNGTRRLLHSNIHKCHTPCHTEQLERTQRHRLESRRPHIARKTPTRRPQKVPLIHRGGRHWPLL